RKPGRGRQRQPRAGVHADPEPAGRGRWRGLHRRHRGRQRPCRQRLRGGAGHRAAHRRGRVERADRGHRQRRHHAGARRELPPGDHRRHRRGAGQPGRHGTILNDDFSLLPIHAIQGSGARSPLEGQVVATSGIVTGRRSAGFFLQAPNAEADGDPATSEGIYVYTGSTPPAAAAVGHRVKVQGTVLEYVPSADPAQPPLTELGGTPTVLLESTGHALPTPVALTASFPDPNGAYDQLERLEGMRVTAAGLTVNTPTGGSVAESTASATSNGVFHAVVAGVARAYREPGVQLPD
ncbi:hypothetical protein HF319_18265, partial [Xanthomonas sp. Kuri4-1]